MFYQCKNFIYNYLSFFLGVYTSTPLKRTAWDETQAKYHSKTLSKHRIPRGSRVSWGNLVASMWQFYFVFLKDNRRALEHAHHRDTVPLSSDIAEVDALSLLNWFSKFVMEASKHLRHLPPRYPPPLKTVQHCVLSRYIWTEMDQTEAFNPLNTSDKGHCE